MTRLPSSPEAERGLVACCLLHPDALDLCCEHRVTKEWFLDLALAGLYGVCVDLHLEGAVVEPMVVFNEATKRGMDREQCNPALLGDLSNETPSSHAAGYFIDVLREKLYARAVIVQAESLIDAAREGVEMQGMVDAVETRIMGLRNLGVAQAASTRRESLERVVDQMEAARQRDGALLGHSTGLRGLDRMLDGLCDKRLYIIAARPGQGKTALALNMAEAIAGNGVPVAFFSLEMPEDQLNARSLAAEAMVNMCRLKNGCLTERDAGRLPSAMARLARNPIHFRDRGDLTISQLRAECRRMVTKLGIRVVFVDYLQLVSGSRRFENRSNEVAEVSRGLKAMALELGVPVVAMSQLSRDLDKNAGRQPRLSDLRESGAIEQDADAVMFIHCPDELKEEDGRLPVSLVVAKNRQGECGTLGLIFDKPHTRLSQDLDL